MIWHNVVAQVIVHVIKLYSAESHLLRIEEERAFVIKLLTSIRIAEVVVKDGKSILGFAMTSCFAALDNL